MDKYIKIENEKLQMQLENQKKEISLILYLVDKPLPKNGLPLHINILTAKALLEQDMAKNNYQVIFDEAGNLILKQRKDGALIDVFENNKKLDVNGYIDGTLAARKFVEATDQNSSKPTPAPGNNTSQLFLNNNNPKNAAVVEESRLKLKEIGI